MTWGPTKKAAATCGTRRPDPGPHPAGHPARQRRPGLVTGLVLALAGTGLALALTAARPPSSLPSHVDVAVTAATGGTPTTTTTTSPVTTTTTAPATTTTTSPATTTTTTTSPVATTTTTPSDTNRRPGGEGGTTVVQPAPSVQVEDSSGHPIGDH